MSLEIWKQHIYLSLYEVSNEGRVRNKITGEELTPTYTSSTNVIVISYNLYNKNRHKYEKHSRSRLLREHWQYEFIKYLEEGEECKEVDGCSGYFITSKGRVWSSKNQCWMKIRPHQTYYHCCSVNGKKHIIHQLVGRHFIPDYEDGLFILHRDETLPFPEINYVENLWVGTPQDNSKDMVEKGRGRWDKITS